MRTIIVAEDDMDAGYLLKARLRQEGFEVELLPEGSSLVSRSKPWPDLFILDKNIPIIDGLALCKFLRLHAETRDIPIIMISASHELRQRAMDAGVNHFFGKPFEMNELMNIIIQVINSRDVSLGG